MKLRGEKLKEIRKRKGLSQAALAEGICTQASVSLMEKQNRIPKMGILTAICDRLGIKTEDIIAVDDAGFDKKFDRVANLIVSQQFKTAEQLLKSINVKDLEGDYYKQRYYYMLGTVQVGLNQLDDAIFNFELVLTQFSTSAANIILAMTTIGMAEAYVKLGSKDRAQRLVERAVGMIDNKKVTASNREWILAYYHLAELQLQLGQPQQAITMAKRGTQLCKQNNFLLMLDDYYRCLGKGYAALNDKKAATENLQLARSLSVVRQRPELTAEIDSDMRQLNAG